MFKPLHSYSILQVAYLLFFALLPFIYSSEVMDRVLVPRQAFLSVFLLFVWTIVLITKKFKIVSIQNSLLSRRLLLFYGFIVALSFLSTIWAHLFSESSYVASKYGIVFLFFITTYYLLSAQFISKKDLIRSILLFCAIGLCYGLYDVTMLFVIGSSPLQQPLLLTATFANKNLFASVLLLCTWAIFAGRLHNVLRLFLLTIVSIFMVLLQSKIVVAAFTLLLLVLALKNASLLKLHKTKVMAVAMVVAVVFIALLFNLSHFKNLSSLHTLYIRSGLWNNSMQMAAEYPFGVGAGNWQVFFQKYGLWHSDDALVLNGTRLCRQPHNDFIWMLCELGWAGFLFYASIFVTAFVMLLHLYKKNKSNLSFLLLITLVAYALVAFFDFPLERMEHQVLFATILAIAASEYDMAFPSQKTFKLLKYWPAYVALIGMSLVTCFYRLKGEYYTRQAIVLDKQKFANEVISDCDKARSVFYTIDAITIPVDWYAAVALFKQHQTTAARLKLEQALHDTPYNIRMLHNLGNLYAREGQRAKAVACFKVALQISPCVKVGILK